MDDPEPFRRERGYGWVENVVRIYEPPKEIVRRAYLAACEARRRHLQQMETWEKTTEEEQRRIRVEWFAVHERVRELEDAAGAMLRDPTIQARQRLADVLRPHRRSHQEGEAAASPRS